MEEAVLPHVPTKITARAFCEGKRGFLECLGKDREEDGHVLEIGGEFRARHGYKAIDSRVPRLACDKSSRQVCELLRGLHVTVTGHVT